MRDILKTLWERWKKIAHTLGLWQAKILLTVIYVLLSPMGIAFRFQKPATRWQKKDTHTSINDQY